MGWGARKRLLRSVHIGGIHTCHGHSGSHIAWHRTRYLEGAWTSPPYGTPGYDLLLKPAGRVHFAGDWLSHEVAWQHGAFVSARAAVTALHSRVMTTA